ncbi:hypothetical protein MNBD_PLANCTO02-3129 [hydrothermal vent metagenome]|uniref:RNA polymerase sigma-70 region 2 domain-containing protein n=1 Tax=hydrothermal vent metagenome TaxID=652676 RepID=A0A3B1DNH5_9ZZZZ
MSIDRFSKSDAARLLTQYQAALYRYVFTCVRNHADAEDILQDVSMIVVKRIRRLESEQQFFAWAKEIAFRQILAFSRKSKRLKSLNPHVVAALAESAGRVEKSEPTSQRTEALQECLKRLPPLSQELIKSRYDGSVKKVSDIAIQYESEVGAIYAKLNRIKQILRDCISRRLSSEGSQ